MPRTAPRKSDISILDTSYRWNHGHNTTVINTNEQTTLPTSWRRRNEDSGRNLQITQTHTTHQQQEEPVFFSLSPNTIGGINSIDTTRHENSVIHDSVMGIDDPVNLGRISSIWGLPDLCTTTIAAPVVDNFTSAQSLKHHTSISQLFTLYSQECSQRCLLSAARELTCMILPVPYELQSSLNNLHDTPEMPSQFVIRSLQGTLIHQVRLLFEQGLYSRILWILHDIVYEVSVTGVCVWYYLILFIFIDIY